MIFDPIFSYVLVWGQKLQSNCSRALLYFQREFEYSSSSRTKLSHKYIFRSSLLIALSHHRSKSWAFFLRIVMATIAVPIFRIPMSYNSYQSAERVGKKRYTPMVEASSETKATSVWSKRECI